MMNLLLIGFIFPETHAESRPWPAATTTIRRPWLTSHLAVPPSLRTMEYRAFRLPSAYYAYRVASRCALKQFREKNHVVAQFDGDPRDSGFFFSCEITGIRQQAFKGYD